MNVVFVYAGFENLGIEYLSAVLKKAGHATRLAFDPRLFNDQFISIPGLRDLFDYSKLLLVDIIRYDPQLVAFSVVSSDYLWSLKVAAEIKRLRPEIKTVFGGVHPTGAADEVLRHPEVDFVVRGEGEGAIVELADALDAGSSTDGIRNLSFRDREGQPHHNPLRPLIDDLDSLPFPDRRLYLDLIPSYEVGYMLLTRRGCTYNCSYCHHSMLNKLYPESKKKIRLRSVDNVMQELEQVHREHPFKSLRINDDLFSWNEKWLGEWSTRYTEKIGKPFMCFVSAGTTTEKVADHLKKANCFQVCIGVQSPTARVREEIFNRHEKDATISRALSLYKERRIRCSVDNIIGYPDQTTEELKNLVRFYAGGTVFGRVATFWLLYHPGTDIVDIAIKRGALSLSDIENIPREPDFTANTIQGARHSKEYRRFHLLVLATHFLPKSAIEWLLKNNHYRRIPLINPSLIEIPMTLLAQDRHDPARRHYFRRYLHYWYKILLRKLTDNPPGPVA